MFLKIVITILCITTVFCDIIHIRKHVKQRPPHIHNIHAKHHKRGAFSIIPPFKAGYDIPVVSHSFIKPLVVQYPTKSVPIGVKIPFKHPSEHQHPQPVGHDIPTPLPGQGINIPGWSKPLIIPLPTRVNHVYQPVVPFVPAPPPAIPVVPTVPAAPSVQVPVPLPPPPAPTVPVNHFVPSPPLVNFRPIVPYHSVAFHQPPLVSVHPQPGGLIPLPQPTPLVPVQPVAPQQHVYPAIIRPGNAVQQSVFATFPRHQLIPQHHIQFVQPQLRPFLIGRPHFTPTQVLIPQPQHPTAFVPEHQPPHLIPGGSAFTPGVVQPEHPPSHNQEHHPSHGYPQAQSHTYSQEQHIPVFENNGESHDFQAQFNHQPNFEQQQFEYDQQQQFLQHHQHQIHQQQEQQQFLEQQQNELHHQQQFLDQQQHQIHQQQQQQEYHQQFLEQQHQLEHDQNELHQFHQQQIDQARYNQQQQYHQQVHQEYGPPPQQEYGPPPQQHYGLPQHQERSDNSQESQESRSESESNEDIIPSSLQPPIDRPLEDF